LASPEHPEGTKAGGRNTHLNKGPRERHTLPMTRATYYKVSIWIPLALPLAVAAVATAGLLPTALYPVGQFLIGGLPYYGLPYLALAIWASFWIKNKDESDIVIMAFRAPILMAGIFTACAMAVGVIVGQPGVFAAMSLLGIIASLLAGYAYVCLVMLARPRV